MSRSPWNLVVAFEVRNSGGRRTAEGRDQFLRIVPVELGGPSHCPRDARTGLVAKPQGLDHAHAHSSRLALRHLALQSDLPRTYVARRGHALQRSCSARRA